VPRDPFLLFASLLVLVFSVVLHEVAHARVARAFGDRTAEEQGRLTLNPLRHVDPVMSLLVPLAVLWASNGAYAFGAARPVPVNPARLRTPGAAILVAAAGPATNVAIGLASGLLYAGFLRAGVFDFGDKGSIVLGRATATNFFLAAFNLVPVPPLDGARVVGGLFPRSLGRLFEAIEPYAFLVLLALIAGRVLDPVFSATAAPATEGWLRFLERTIVRGG
jgi:Zn-dependent protease